MLNLTLLLHQNWKRVPLILTSSWVLWPKFRKSTKIGEERWTQKRELSQQMWKDWTNEFKRIIKKQRSMSSKRNLERKEADSKCKIFSRSDVGCLPWRAIQHIAESTNYCNARKIMLASHDNIKTQFLRYKYHENNPEYHFTCSRKQASHPRVAIKATKVACDAFLWLSESRPNKIVKRPRIIDDAKSSISHSPTKV